MKIKKRVLCPERLRRVPGQFSWIDQRLVRDRYLQRCDHGALALYLVLLTVADAEGLSYYSDTTLERMLNMEHGRLLNSRHQLCQAGLLAYDKPLSQILSAHLIWNASLAVHADAEHRWSLGVAGTNLLDARFFPGTPPSAPAYRDYALAERIGQRLWLTLRYSMD